MVKDFLGKMPDWLKVLIDCFFYVFLVYSISNLIFILSALQMNGAFLDSFYFVISNEANNGQILTLVCALIAPIFYWLWVEKNKHYVKFVIMIISFIVLLLSGILQYAPSALPSFKSSYVYLVAIFIWIASVFAEKFPPELKGYGRTMDEDANRFADAAKEAMK